MSINGMGGLAIGRKKLIATDDCCCFCWLKITHNLHYNIFWVERQYNGRFQ
jgi:hypothetical protein